MQRRWWTLHFILVCLNSVAGKLAVRHLTETIDTGEPVFFPFRMSCFVLSNLIVTAGMLTPGLGVRLPLVSSFLSFFLTLTLVRLKDECSLTSH